MYYMGTIILGMSDQEFWRCLPRKFYALLRVHQKRYEKTNEEPVGYIDQVL
jgi:hypothetical protein